ncbi:glucosaminidase domain-containing protein [Streptococcus caprae]|uniref:Glucosaminidase domain-containing protein n=1 Tax=Streptococcus caprae TaxID=1640501 RepID=A0ABV8CWL1_9STRE
MTLLASSAIFALTTYREPVQTANAETTYNQTTADFINSIGETARQIGQEYDLYASVMIAQAVLESSNGQSTLSQAPYYNFFGIKGDYNGNSVSMLTWEDDGTGRAYNIYADFRSYGSVAGSLYDYANLLNTPIYANARKSNSSSYADVTAALTGLYATDTNYGAKLNAIIEYYGLTAYDEPVASYYSEETSDGTLVWNEHRGQYTTPEILQEDENWLTHTGRR